MTTNVIDFAAFVKKADQPAATTTAAITASTTDLLNLLMHAMMVEQDMRKAVKIYSKMQLKMRHDEIEVPLEVVQDIGLMKIKALQQKLMSSV